MKISFIVPVYNVGEYLPRCLDSMLAIKSVDWECILIDDGSTDNSWSIICGYAEKYPDKFISRRKENGGVSSARNTGLDMASGDRIAFVDGDDYFFPEADGFFSRVINEFGDKDQILYKFLKVYADGTAKKATELGGCAPNLDLNEIIIRNALVGSWASICILQLYKTSVIKKYNIRFDESMRMREDLNFSLDYTMHTNGIATFDNEIYAYCQRDDSAVKKLYESDWEDIKKYFNKCTEVIESRNIKLDKRQADDLNFYHVKIVIGLFIELYPDLSLREFKRKCKEIFSVSEFKEVIESGRVRSISYFLVKNKMYTLFWLAVRLRKLIRKIKL